jgi:cell division protein FtsN
MPNTDKRLFDSIDNRTRTDAEKGLGNDAVVEEVKAESNGVPRDIRPAVSTPARMQAERTEVPTPKTTEVKPEPVKEAPAPVVSAPRPLPPLTSPSSTFDQSGQYLVQIMALKDQASAEKAWAQLVEKNTDLFGGAVLDVQRADLGAKGVFYRVRASAFADRAGADDFCSQLKARGQGCIVTSR